MEKIYRPLHGHGPLWEKSFHLSVRIVKLYKYLAIEKREFVMSKQILKSGTSPGALIREARNAESTKDFIHKLAIAQKEAGETLYWLELLHATDFISEPEFNSIYSDTQEVMKLLRSSILTKKKAI